METPTTAGALPRRTSSSSTESPIHGWRELLLLAGAGLLAVVLHKTFNWPMRMPGHHGLEWMAILVFSRCASGQAWAGLVVGMGAATGSVLPGIGSHESLTWFFYLLPGVVMDLAWRVPAAIRDKLLFLAAAAAVAHATKPAARWLLAEGFGMQFGSFRSGHVFPIASHMMFGFVGGFMGALAWRLSQRVRRRGP